MVSRRASLMGPTPRQSQSQAAERMRENERLLMEESAEAEILEDTLRSSEELTTRMVKMLNSFDQRLLSFEKSILPIHRTTMRLNRYHENIEKTLHLTTKMIEYFDLADRVSRNLSFDGKITMILLETDIKPYIGYMTRIAEAFVALTSIKVESAERAIYKLRQRFNLGIYELSQLYKRWLTDLSQPVKDIALMPATKMALPDEKIMGELGSLASWMTNIVMPYNQSHHPYQLYPDVRSVYLLNSLTHLESMALNDFKRCSTVFIQQIKVFTRLLEAEHEVIKGALDFETADVWSRTVSPAIKLVVETGEKVLQAIVQRNDFSLVFMHFDVLDFWGIHSEVLLPQIEDIPGKKRAFTNLFDTWTITAMRVIPGFLEDIKSNTKATVPPDATVHEITSNTMAFTKQLLEHPDTAESVLLTIGEENWGNQNLNITDIKYVKSQTTLTTKYIDLVLTALDKNLESKAKLYKKPTHVSMFLVNNINYLLKSLRGCKGCPESIYEHFQKVLKNLRNQLVDVTAGQILSNLMDVTRIEGGHIASSFSSSERNMVKEKFKNFNGHMEDMLKLISSCTIPDSEMQKTLTADFSRLILPMFERFYNKYAKSDFSKNKDKYIKYTPVSVRAEIEKLFGQS